MRTSCQIGDSKIMIYHNGELIYGIERTLGIMIQSVNWTNARCSWLRQYSEYEEVIWF